LEGAIRFVSIGRGKDPRELACVTFGGAGPIHGARLARSLGIRRVIVPFAAGVASALGLLIADARFDFARTLVVPLDGAPWDRIDQLFGEMEAEGMAQLRATGLAGEWRQRRSVEVRYAGQGHELTVEIPGVRLSASSLPELQRAHADVYAAHYGYAEPIGAPLEATNWKLEVRCVPPTTSGARTPRAGRPRGAADAREARKADRDVYFPETRGFVACPVYDRYRLGEGSVITGPAIVEERETTVVVLPGDRAFVDAHANLMMDIT
jgi:N-methylhydantoinase A